MDLIIRNANLPDGRAGVDIGVAGERIAAVEPNLDAKAASEIDATGRLVTPPFVDAHFHMDATLSYGFPRVNRSGQRDYGSDIPDNRYHPHDIPSR